MTVGPDGMLQLAAPGDEPAGMALPALDGPNPAQIMLEMMQHTGPEPPEGAVLGTFWFDTLEQILKRMGPHGEWLNLIALNELEAMEAAP